MPAVINFHVSALLIVFRNSQFISIDLLCALKIMITELDDHSEWSIQGLKIILGLSWTLHWSVTVSIKGSKNLEISKNFRSMTTMVIRSTFCYV